MKVCVDENEGGDMGQARWWGVVNATALHVEDLDCFLSLRSQRMSEESSATRPRAGLMPKQTRWPSFQEGTHPGSTEDNFQSRHDIKSRSFFL